ncbi:MFS transporter [Palleronia sp. LCG004]|uniref:MFS transporter n=1 Tax=Palleronia sp. LCG004 TaxID=3079304 RepID=UPI00294312A2|nr:MFS transporter [Palleronia sp. LCG004]WOI58150.1 MFS transporter [Palleronia sp. LCG004]
MGSLLKDRRAVALLLAATLTVMSNSIISPGLPGIASYFSTTPNADLLTRLLITAPSLTVALTAPFAGFFVDRMGRKTMLITGAALFGAAGSSGLWAPTLPILLGTRLVLGVGVAMLMTAMTALVAQFFHGAERGRFMAMQMTFINFGGLVFIAVAGQLANMSSFYPFGLYLVGLVYLPILYACLQEPKGGAAAVTDHADDAGQEGWQMVLGLGLVLLALTFATFYILPTQIAFYLAQLGHTDPSTAALMMVCVTFAAGAISIVYPKLRVALGRGGVLGAGFALLAAGFLLMSYAEPVPVIAAASLLVGMGPGLIVPTLLSSTLDAVPARHHGMASGALTFSLFIGQFISPILTQPLIEAGGFHLAFMTFAAAALAGAAIAVSIFRERGAQLARA